VSISVVPQSEQPEQTPSSTPVAGPEQAVFEVVANEYITLRAEPSTGGEPLAQLPAGERVTCLGFEGIFMKVRTQGGQQGYVHGGYVKSVEDNPSDLSFVRSDGSPYTYALMERDLDALQAAYPDTFTRQTLAQTADGRAVELCVIGSSDAAHKVLVTAAIHGREYMTTLLVMSLMERYLAAMPQGAADVAFYVMPMLNPDGVTVSQFGVFGLADNGLRASVESILEDEETDALLWKANARGVDLNRNFPAGWDALDGSGPASTRYRGETPLSEAETQAVAQLFEQVRFDATLNYHATGSVQYWQYGADEALQARTRTLAEAVYAATGYPLSQDESSLESGGLRDWALQAYGVPSVTVEVGCLEAPLSAQEWGGIWQRNQGMFDVLVDYVTE
jgi:g-D-glutamyl-meso-diaminopimelate peptidase